MDESPGVPEQLPVPPSPDLPAVDSPPTQEVLDRVPSKEDVVAEAQSASDIVREQPSVDDILGPDRQ